MKNRRIVTLALVFILVQTGLSFALPDLVITNMSYEVSNTSQPENSLVKFNALMKNIGDVTINRTFYNCNSFGSLSGCQIYQGDYLPIGPSEEKLISTGSRTFSKSEGFSEEVTLSADRNLHLPELDNLIIESDEGNNEITSYVYIAGENPSCVDSDGGKNYFVQGTTTKGEFVYTDHCAQGLLAVNEYYCTVDGDIEIETDHECSAGCLNGACNVENNQSECGDGICSGNESCYTCAVDCGSCSECGDGVCNEDENCETCAIDCVCAVCGNIVCESGESTENCPEDCAQNNNAAYYKYVLVDDDCSVELSVSVPTGEITLSANWQNDVCTNNFDEEVTANAGETKTLNHDSMGSGTYHLMISGTGDYTLSKSNNCLTDLTPPNIETNNAPETLDEDILLDADVSDSNSGLKANCQVCISSDGVCDSEWLDATNNFIEGDNDGSCSFLWQVSEYDDAVYTVKFRISDLSDNVKTGMPMYTLLDTNYPFIRLLQLTNPVSKNGDITIVVNVSDGAGIQSVKMVFDSEIVYVNESIVSSTSIHRLEMPAPVNPGNYLLIIEAIDHFGRNVSVDYIIRVDENVQWSTELQLTRSDSDVPDVASDEYENLHIVWSDNMDGNYEIYYTRFDSSGKIALYNKRLSNNFYNSKNPSIAVDSANNLHIVWQDDRDGNKEIYYTQLSGSGQKIISEQRLTYNLFDSINPSLATDNQYIHVLWLDTKHDITDIYYKKIDSNGNVVVADKRVTIDADVVSYSVVSDAGLVYVLYQNALNEIMFIIISDGEVTFGKKIIAGSQPDISINDNINAVWISAGGTLTYARLDKNDGLILLTKNITMASGVAEPDIESDLDGSFHLVWLDDQNEVYYTKYDGNASVAVSGRRITSGSTNANEPKMALGSVHIVYTDDNGSDGNLYLKTTIFDSDPPMITDVSVSDISPYSARISWKTDEPSTSTVRYGPGFVLLMESPTLTTEHEMTLTNLVYATSYSFEVVSRDIFFNQQSDNNENYVFTTQKTKNKPALPTTFYGKVVYQNGTPVPKVAVTSQWLDTDNVSRESAAITLNVSEAMALGNASLEGYYFFNTGKIQALKGSIITVFTDSSITKPDPYVIAEPGGVSSKVVGGPLIVDSGPPQIIISYPTESNYFSTNLYLEYSINEEVNWVSFAINNQDPVIVTGINPVNITAKIDQNILTVLAEDLLGLQNYETVIFTVEDNVIPVVLLNSVDVIYATITLSANVSDASNPLTESCEICISTDGICDTEWTTDNVVSLLMPGDLVGKCVYDWETANIPSAMYTINFRVFDESGNLGTGDPIQESVDRVAPNPVLDLSVSTVRRLNALDLHYLANNDSDFYAYNIYRSNTYFEDVNNAMLVTTIYHIEVTNFRDTNLTYEKTYYYAVSAIDQSMNENTVVTAMSGTVDDITSPIIQIIAPANLTYTVNEIDVEFTVNEEVVCEYSLNEDKNGIMASPAIIHANEGVNKLDISCSDSALNNATASVLFYVDTTAPTRVDGLQVETLTGENSLNLTWQPSLEADFDSYNIYRLQTSFNDVTEMDPVVIRDVPFFLDTGLISETTYYYAVTAVDASGNENKIVQSVSGTTPDSTPPGQITGLTVAHFSGETKLELEWQASTAQDFAYYKIYRFGTSFSDITLIDPIADTDSLTYVDNNLESERTYYYAVTAVDTNENEKMEVVSVFGKVADLNPPTVVIVSPKHNITYISDKVLVNYFVNEDTSWCGYSVNNEEYIELSASTTVSVIEGENSIVVKCTDLSGNEGSSIIVDFGAGIPPATITGVNVSGVFEDQAIDISWDASTEEDFSEYRIYKAEEQFSNVSTGISNNIDIIETGATEYYVTGEVADASAVIEIVESDETGMLIRITDISTETAEFEINQQPYQILTVPNYGYTGVVGKPQLPVIRELLTIPPVLQANVQIVDSEYDVLTGYNIYPVQQEPPDFGGINSILTLPYGKNVGPITEDHFIIDNEFYASDLFYPGKVADVAPPGYMRGLKLTQLIINPIQYNPLSKEIRKYNEVILRINYEPDPNAALSLPLANQDDKDTFREIYKNSVLNYEEGVKKSSDDSIIPLFALAGEGLLDTANRADYLIIYADTFANKVTRLVNWKEGRGLEVIDVKLSDIYSEFGSGDVGIREFIKYAYFNWELPPTYVLLVGDVDHLPIHNYPCFYCSYKSNTPGDHYYACVDGEDYYPDLHVGRLPVKNNGELSVMIDKIIAYQSGGGTDWKKKILFVAHPEDAPEKYQGCKEYIAENIVSDEYELDKVYPYNGGSKTDIIEAMEEGRGIINYRGHGSTYSWSISPSFGTGDINNLQNNDKTPIVYSIACWNNRIDYSTDSFGEVFTKKENGGAIVHLGATIPSPTTVNHEFDKNLFRATFNDGLSSVGEIMTQAKTRLLNTYGGTHSTAVAETWMFLILGDPEISIDTTSADLSVTDVLTNSTSPIVGDNVVILAKARNLGEADAQNVIVRFYDGNPGAQIGEVLVDNLGPASYEDISIVWNTTGYLGGLYTIYAKVDPNNVISEANENNNMDSVAIKLNAVRLIAVIKDISVTSYRDFNVSEKKTYYYAVTAVDDKGYEEEIVDSVEVTVPDFFSPVVNISSPFNTSYDEKNVELVFSVNEEILSCEYSLNNGENITVESSATILADNGVNILIVYCRDLAGNIGFDITSFFVDNIPPDSVIGLNVVSIAGESKLGLEWNKSDANDFAAYNIYRFDQEFQSVINASLINSITDINTNGYVDEGLNSEQEYYYAVTVLDKAENENTIVEPVTGKVADITPPDKITGLKVETLAGQRSLNISWNPSNASDFANYSIYRSRNLFGSTIGIELIKQKSDEFYIDSNLLDGSIYHYAVLATDFSGNEDTGVDSVSGIVADLTPPVITITSPQNITYNSNDVVLSYSTNEEVASCNYSLNYIEPTSATGTINGIEGQNSLIVYCTDIFGNQGQSEIVLFIVDTTPPNQVSGLLVNTVAMEAMLDLFWNPIDGVSTYRVYRSGSEFNDVSQMAPVYATSETSYVDSDVISEVTYYYAVTGEDKAGNENPVVVTVAGTVADLIPPEKIVGLAVDPVEGNNVLDLSWDLSHATDYAHYNIYRSMRAFESTIAEDSLGEFYSGGGLLTMRSGPAVAELANGNIIVVGGYWSSALFGQYYLSSTEIIFPPAINGGEYSKIYGPPMKAERRNPTATSLSDGKVLVVGGIYHSQKIGTAEVFDPNGNNGEGEFTLLPEGCSPAADHLYQTATLLKNGKVLIAGGYTDSAELYDPDTGCFEETGSMAISRNGHTATLLNNGQVLIVGEYAATKAEIYNPALGLFTNTAGDLTTDRSHHAATLLDDGRVLLVGGISYSGEASTSAEYYDPNTNKFSRIESLLTIGRDNHDAYTLPNGKVVIYGGNDAQDNVLQSVEIFDPATETFTLLEQITYVKPYHDSKQLSDGRIYMAGGLLQGSTNSYIFDPGLSVSVEQISQIGNRDQTTLRDTDLISNGVYYYAVTAADEDGNENTDVISVAGTVADLTPPIITIISPVNQTYNTKSIELLYVADENVDNCKYKLNDGPYIDYTQEITAQEGFNTIKMSCMDASSNSGESEIVSFMVDSTPPDAIEGLTVNAVPRELVLELSWNPSAAEDFAYYKIYRSISEFDNVEGMESISEPLGNSYNDTGLVSGQTYYYAVTAVDYRGNEDFTVSVSSMIVSDLIPPEQITGLIVQTMQKENSLDLTWDESNADDLHHYSIYRSGNEFSSVVSMIPVINTTIAHFKDNGLVSQAEYYYAITAIDNSGNMDENVVFVKGLVADTIKPNISLISPINKKYNYNIIDLSYDVTEPVNNCFYILNFEHERSVEPTITAQEGPNTIKVSCNDTSDNSGESDFLSFTVDTIPPDNIDSVVVSTLLNAASLELEWQGTQAEDLSHYNIYRSMSEFDDVYDMIPIDSTSSTNYININLVSEETYHYAVTAVDDSGNENKIVESVQGTVADIIPPLIQIISPKNTRYAEYSVNLSYGVDEEVLWCNYMLNNQSQVVAESGATLIGVEGINVLEMSCIDLSENIGYATVLFEIDRDPPSIIHGVVVNAVKGENSLDISWDPSTAADFDHYSVYRAVESFSNVTGMDSIAAGQTNNYLDTQLISEAEYYYAVTAVDMFGNENMEVVSVLGVVADTIPPDKVIGLNITQIGNQVGLKISWDENNESDLMNYRLYKSLDNYSDVSSMAPFAILEESTYPDVDLIEGRLYYYAVTAVDASDNENTTVLTIAGTAPDITPPTVTVNSIGNKVAGTALLSATLTDTGVGLAKNCEVCITEDGECQWTEAISDFDENDKNGSCFYEWDTEAYANKTIAYNFKASDMLNNERIGESLETVVMQITNISEFNIQLAADWNLISLPLVPYDKSTAVVLSSIDGRYKKIYYYNSDSQNWEVYNPDRSIFDQKNNLLQLDIGKSYWIELTEPAVLHVVGYRPSEFSMELSQDWNFIGYPYTLQENITNALSSISDEYYKIYSYDAVLKKYDVYKPYDTIYEPNSIINMEPGKGYVLYMKNNAQWHP
ncbi:MAG: C25 family cysteine peptidase [Nanoarchaeota archaeon]